MRPRRAASTVLFAVFSLLLLQALSLAAEPCQLIAEPFAAKSASASASFWQNLNNKRGSLRFESERLLGEAVERARESSFNGGVCPTHCSASEVEIEFRSVPQRFLSGYGEEKDCEILQRKTSAAPLTFGELKFPTVSQLTDWISDFSQGKGREGRELYRRCPGSCSPQFSYTIVPTKLGFTIFPQAVCGPARDKKHDQYLLEYKIRRRCV